MPGVGGPSIGPLFPMNSFYPASGGSGTISAGSVVYLPFYSYAGGVLDLVELYSLSVGSGFTGMSWAVLDHDASNGGPGTVLDSGSVSSGSFGSGVWVSIPVNSVSLSADTYYLFRFSPQGGSLSIMSPQTAPYVLPIMYAHPKPVLSWSGSSWGNYIGNPYRNWSFMYRIGGVWYGQPLTNGNSGVPLSANEWGLSFVLPQELPLLGCIFTETYSSPLTNIGFTVRVYNCDSSTFLPLGSPLVSVQAYPTVMRGISSGESYRDLLVMFPSVLNLKNFSVVIMNGPSGPVYAYDAGTGSDLRLNRVYPFVRSVKNVSGSWQVVTNSGTSVIATQIGLLIGGEGGGSVKGIVPPLFRGVERC
jgi:hypothetical protein